MNPYEEAGKQMGRGAARLSGQPVTDGMLPRPTAISEPVPRWRVSNQGAGASEEDLVVRRVKRPRSDSPVLLIEQGGQVVHVHPVAIDSLYDALRAAKIWKAT